MSINIPGTGVHLMLNLLQQMLKLLGLLREAVLLAHEREQLGLERRVQARDHELHRVAYLADALIFSGAHRFYVTLLRALLQIINKKSL